MTPDEIRSFVERWQLVNERERQELRTTPLSLKLAQLAALMESARGLGWETTSASEIEEVRRRWNRLREVARD